MIKGITVVLHSNFAEGETEAETTKDALNRESYTQIETQIENVLVAPSSAQEIADTESLYGRKAVYTLAIPKGDAHVWTGGQVEFFGRTWNVIGDLQQGIEGLIPGDWNAKVTVEAINEQ